jgi:hypothetical protein
MFPRVGFQILSEQGSPEDFHVMEVENVSRDEATVTGFEGIARQMNVFGKVRGKP